MLRTRTWVTASVLFTTALLLAPAPALAQNHSVNFTVGAFIPTGFDGRADEDILVNELSGPYRLAFDVRDFNGATVGVDWLVGFGRYIDAGLGVAYYRRTVPSVYDLFTHPSGAEIEQDLRLRIVPITASVRIYPMGKYSGFQPYIGGGVAFLSWRYSEAGDFVDPVDDSIFDFRYEHDDTTAAPVFLGGLRATVGDRAIVGGEVRYQKAEGDLPTGGTEGFISDRIDLGGWTTNFTIGVRF